MLTHHEGSDLSGDEKLAWLKINTTFVCLEKENTEKTKQE